MVNTKTRGTSHKPLSLNTWRSVHVMEAYDAWVLLSDRKIRSDVHRSDEGHWLNVWWPNGVIAPLTFQELEQLNQEREDYGTSLD